MLSKPSSTPRFKDKDAARFRIIGSSDKQRHVGITLAMNKIVIFKVFYFLLSFTVAYIIFTHLGYVKTASSKLFPGLKSSLA